MSRIVYVNGRFVPESEAHISVFDRGFLFGDGVYEVSSVLAGGLVDNAAHLARLERSLGELGMASPASPEEIVKRAEGAHRAQRPHGRRRLPPDHARPRRP